MPEPEDEETAAVRRQLRAAADEIEAARDPQAALRSHGITDVPPGSVADFVTELRDAAG